MANANRPSGFSPVQYLNGSPWNGQARIYSIAAAYATALYIGDPVKSSGTADANGVPGIVLGATTGALRGVIVGLGSAEGLIANPKNLDITYRPAAAQATDCTQWSWMIQMCCSKCKRTLTVRPWPRLKSASTPFRCLALAVVSCLAGCLLPPLTLPRPPPPPSSSA